MLEKATKQRVVLLLADLVAVAVAIFAGGAVAGLAFHVINYGVQTPEMFGWSGLSFLFGAMGLIIAGVAGVVAVAAEIIGNRPPLQSMVWMLVLGLPFGILAVAVRLMINPEDTDVPAACVSGAFCAAVSLALAVVRVRHFARTST